LFPPAQAVWFEQEGARNKSFLADNLIPNSIMTPSPLSSCFKSFFQSFFQSLQKPEAGKKGLALSFTVDRNAPKAANYSTARRRRVFPTPLSPFSS